MYACRSLSTLIAIFMYEYLGNAIVSGQYLCSFLNGLQSDQRVALQALQEVIQV